MQKKRLQAIVCVAPIVLACLSSCRIALPSHGKFQRESGYCYPAVLHLYDTASKPLDSLSMIALMPVRKPYSRHSIMVANAAGVLNILKRMDDEAFHSAGWWQLHQQVISRLFLVSTQIESIAAELDCEGERADQVADYLTQHENQRVKKLTILSIMFGAVGGIGNAVLKSHGAAVASAVVGGTLSAGLGLSALLSGHKVTFEHRRNLLADLWTEKPASSIYPPPIWYMLTEKYFSNEQKSAIAANMKSRWIAYEGLRPGDKKSSQTIRLLFGPGGEYSADDLRSRARMLNQVQAAIKLMNQDLQELVEEISR